MHPPALALRNIRTLVSCSDAIGTQNNVDMVCEAGFITAIGAGVIPDDFAGEIIDADRYFIYPGLINTHHHFFQAFVRNQAMLNWHQLSVVEWLRTIYPIFALTDADCIFHTSMVAMAELLKHGCTTAFDHQYCYSRHAGKELVDRQFAAADLTGIRYVAGRGTNTLPPELGSTMPVQMVETTDEYLRDCERLYKTFHDSAPGAMRSIVLAPCQPINCFEETFTESIRFAREYGLGLHTHLSEGENAVMLATKGMRSLDWCEEIGFCGPDVWIAHGWEMSRDEMYRMASLDIGLAHCPAPMYLVGDGVTDIPAAHAAGVRIGLGVDGYASNDNSNLLECIRLAYLGQSLVAKTRPDPLPLPHEFLHFATTGGASLLNRPELGALAPGMAADFFAVDATRIELVGAAHNAEVLLTMTGLGREVDITVVNGNVVWRDGEFSGFDQAEAAANATQVFHARIYEQAPLKALRSSK